MNESVNPELDPVLKDQEYAYGEAFALASYLIYWSTNPFQLCHPYLVVIGKASALKSGAHTHA